MIASYRLIAKMPTIAAMAYKFSIGQPFVYPNNSLNYAENFLNMVFSVPAELITYILDVEHQCDVGELFDKMPSKISFNSDTDHRTILNICSQLI